MPRSTNGTYTAPSNSWNPAIVNTTISPADWNATLTDMETALTQSLSTQGQGGMAATLQMGGHAVTGVTFVGFNGASSGSTNLQAFATASGTVTIPAVTDTICVLAAAQALTNKTYNGNTLTTGTYTITGATGKTFTFDNSLTHIGTDGTTQTFPTSSQTIAGLATAQTWSANQTFDSGNFLLAGSSSGTTTINASATASGTITFPAATGIVALATNANVSTVSNSDGTLTISPTSGAVVASIALAHANTWSGNQTFGNGNFLLAGSSSGAMTLEAPATASTYVMTFPAVTDTVVTLGATQTLTSKTLTSPILTTPTLGVALATSINGNTFTTGTYGLTGSAGKTLTFDNSLTLAGTDATTMTFPGTSDTVVTLGTTQTLTNKTLTSPTFTTPALGVATGTSLALGGATIGSNALAITGTFAFSSGGSFGGALTGITTMSASGQITSTETTGTPPFVIASTTQVTNLNVSYLQSYTWASPNWLPI